MRVPDLAPPPSCRNEGSNSSVKDEKGRVRGRGAIAGRREANHLPQLWEGRGPAGGKTQLKSDGVLLGSLS